MIPLRDNIPSRTTPFVNYAFIGVCTLVFLSQLRGPQGQGSLVEQYGMIPARVSQPGQDIRVQDVIVVRDRQGTRFEKRIVREAAPAAVPAWLTLLTCTFLHGGWMHFLGNMWFLHIFGDNVEDRFGHAGYLVFYLATGVAASAAHFATDPSSTVPTIGASGAIAGVMGAYFILYPRAKVLTIIPIFIIIEMIVLPAPIFLGIWFAIQFFQGAFALAGPQATGVAWWAHIGGFVAGLVIAWQLKDHHKLRPAVERVMPHTDRTTVYRMRKDDHPWRRDV